MHWSARTAAVAATVLLSSTLAAGADAAQGPLTCGYTFTQWPGGFSADLTIRNAGPAIDGWSVAWTTPVPTTNEGVWSATPLPSAPTVLAFSNAAWNGRIPTGRAVAFGWTARALSAEVPSDITVNGVACPVTR